MANFPTAAQARERGQGNRIITEEIMLLELAILDSVSSGALEVEFGDSLSDSTQSTILVNGTTVTASPMTDDATYYNVWKETSTDAAKTEQMKEVIDHFQAKGYTISRRSSNNTTLYWLISW